MAWSARRGCGLLVLLAQQNLTFSFEHTALFRKNGVALRWDEIERYRGPAYTQAQRNRAF
jgi:hypothetical protein